MVGVAAALVAVSSGHFMVRFPVIWAVKWIRYDASAGNPQLLPIHVLRHFAVTFFGQNILLIFVAIGMVSWWIWLVLCVGKP